MGRYILFVLVLIAALGFGVMAPECAHSGEGFSALAAGPFRAAPCHEHFVAPGGQQQPDAPLQATLMMSVFLALLTPPLALTVEPAGERRTLPRPTTARPQTPPPRPC